MKRRGLFLDRDGVINEDIGFVSQIKDFVFKPGIFDFLLQAQNKGYRLFIITNQSGVGRGLYSVHDYEELTEWMLKKLKNMGVNIDAVMHCFEKKDEAVVAPYNRESYWRKPSPGMILDAALRYQIDLSCSVLVGDKQSDIDAAEAAGIRQRFLVDSRCVDFHAISHEMGLLC